MESFTFKALDGADIFARAWLPSTAKGVVQIAHGMAEHCLRYDWFARELVEQGFAVYANDHRGHGETAPSEDKLGYFADKDGWDTVVTDLKSLTDVIREKHPGCPVFLFGHSMGSFLSRDYIAHYGKDLAGVALSGTAGDPGLLGKAGLMVSKTQAFFKGGKSPSPLMDKLSFGAYNKAFAPNRTPFDWLSRDPAQVDAYVKDPFCGFLCSTQFYVDLLTGILKISSPEHIAKTPVSLPIYLFSGSMCPVGENGKGVQKTYQAFQKAGITDLSIKLYDQGRHEMLNEINREEVASDAIAWFKAHLPAIKEQ